MIKAILFDLDGTLLPMDEDEFTKYYFKLLCKKLEPYGYDAEKIVSVIWAGTKAMIKNDGSKTNEEVFWQTYASYFGEEKLEDKKFIDEFYINEFRETQKICGENPFAKTLVCTARQHRLKTILATNPLFPKTGILTRLSFIGLGADDFESITSYEFCHYAKPNSKYYKEILKANNLMPEEVIMFGNSEKEDYIPATSIGIKTYLVGEFGKLPDDTQPRITFDEVKDIIKSLK